MNEFDLTIEEMRVLLIHLDNPEQQLFYKVLQQIIERDRVALENAVENDQHGKARELVGGIKRLRKLFNLRRDLSDTMKGQTGAPKRTR